MKIRHVILASAVAALAACGKPAPPAQSPAAPASVAAAASVTAPSLSVARAQLVESEQAFYVGRLACTGCDSSDAELMLQRDRIGRQTYVLRQTQHRGDEVTSPSEAGAWELRADTAGEPPLALLTLDPGRTAPRVFSIGLDGSLEPLDDAVGNTLKHSRGNLDLRALFEALLAG